MKMFKKFIASILSVVILGSMFNINSFAIGEGYNFEFELSADGNSYICKWVNNLNPGSNLNVVIPSTYNGKPVSEISQMAFMSRSDIINITVSDGIKKLGSGCFADMPNLISATIPGSVTEMGSEIFVYCPK